MCLKISSSLLFCENFFLINCLSIFFSLLLQIQKSVNETIWKIYISIRFAQSLNVDTMRKIPKNHAQAQYRNVLFEFACWHQVIVIVEVVNTSKKTLHLVFLVFSSTEAIDSV